MNSYWGLLKTKGVARIMAAQIFARFPSGMISLGLLIHVEGLFGSYGAAGLVLAATSIGQGIAGPFTSRLMGSLGARSVLIATTVICAAALLGIAFLPMPLVGTIIVGLVAGLSFPPVQPAVRTMYPKLVEPAKLPRLFSIDASAQEIIWVFGPMMITLVAMQISSLVGLVVCSAMLVIGGAWFVSSPELGEVHFAPSSGNFGAVLLRGPVVLATVVGFLMIGSTAAIEASVVNRFGEGGLRAGLTLAGMSVASLVAGIMFGHRQSGKFTLSIWMCTMLAGSMLAAQTDTFPMTLVAISLAGLGMAPALAIMFSLISSTISFDQSAEAYGWANTGQLVGAAVGSAAAGFLIDHSGSSGGFHVAAALAALAAVAPLAFFKVRDHRRGRLRRNRPIL
ncbi:MAG: MFS transporter [Propionibacteriaceae bacterium]|nr:MFS transporter [Propionibacteriaceae bacterium]